MPPDRPEHWIEPIRTTLAAVLGLPASDIGTSLAADPIDHGPRILRAGPHTFLVEFKAHAGPGTAAHSAPAILAAAARHERCIPLFASTWLSEATRASCRRDGISWIDLSGNAELTGPGLRVRIEGRPNRFPKRGRPASAFAPKSARLTRWLLMHPEQSPTQRELARATEVSEGFVSRIVGKLHEDGYLSRSDDNRLHVKDHRLLLEAWREDYDFDKHFLLPGHVAARSGEALTRTLSDTLTANDQQHAATGLSAAWQYTRFATFRLASLYLTTPPSEDWLASIGFRAGERGTNVWLIVPDDLGVLHGAAEISGVPCVHPIQTWLDLGFHPERASEAAEELARQTSADEAAR